MVEQLIGALAVPMPADCPKCASQMINVDVMFFAPGGKTWIFALPECPTCNLKDDTATFIPDAGC